MAEVEELVAAFSAALEGTDGETFVAHLAPGAIVWHNHDRKEVDAVENMANIAMLGQIATDIKVETISCLPTPNGFVLQFALHGTVASNGKPLEMQNCLVVTTVDGMITRLDEYVDPTVGAQLAP
jgi:ketosteroid isomerase-like protein